MIHVINAAATCPTISSRENEPAVTTTRGQEYINKSVEIRHESELKGAFKALSDRGIRITSYRED